MKMDLLASVWTLEYGHLTVTIGTKYASASRDIKGDDFAE